MNPAGMEKVRLLGCPFCNSAATLKCEGDHHGEFFELGCPDDECPAHWVFYTAPIEELQTAIKKWNTRTPSPAADEAGCLEAVAGVLYAESYGISAEGAMRVARAILPLIRAEVAKGRTLEREACAAIADSWVGSSMVEDHQRICKALARRIRDRASLAGAASGSIE